MLVGIFRCPLLASAGPADSRLPPGPPAPPTSRSQLSPCSLGGGGTPGLLGSQGLELLAAVVCTALWGAVHWAGAFLALTMATSPLSAAASFAVTGGPCGSKGEPTAESGAWCGGLCMYLLLLNLHFPI